MNTQCGELIPEVVAVRTRGLCPDCFLSDIGDALRQIEIMNRGRRIEMRMPRGSKSKNRGSAKTRQSAENSRQAALKRLRDFYPDLYQVLLAEERAKRGLEPFPIDPTTLSQDQIEVSVNLEMARVYAALDEHGVDVDDLEGQHDRTTQ